MRTLAFMKNGPDGLLIRMKHSLNLNPLLSWSETDWRALGKYMLFSMWLNHNINHLQLKVGTTGIQVRLFLDDLEEYEAEQ